MFEIWTQSKSLSEKFKHYKSTIVINWWGLCLASHIVARIAMKHSEDAVGTDDLMNSSLLYMFSDVLDILNVLIFLPLVNRINIMQETFREEHVKS